MQDLGLTEKEWEHAVRGYILQGRLQFFTGADYHVTRVPPRVLEAAVEMFESLYDGKPEVYYNGVVPGKEGTVWEPLEVFNISNYI